MLKFWEHLVKQFVLVHNYFHIFQQLIIHFQHLQVIKLIRQRAKKNLKKILKNTQENAEETILKNNTRIL